jgi:hypothetical protein
MKTNWGLRTSYYIVIYEPIARQWLGEYIPAEANAQQSDVHY